MDDWQLKAVTVVRLQKLRSLAWFILWRWMLPPG